jgi:nitric oxide reductase subunit B
MQVLRWMRAVGDTVFAAGIVALAWFVIGLATGWSIRKEDEPSDLGGRHIEPARERELVNN